MVSYHGNLKNVCMCMYEYYTVILVPGNPLHSYHGNQMNVYVCITYFRSGACS